MQYYSHLHITFLCCNMAEIKFTGQAEKGHKAVINGYIHILGKELGMHANRHTGFALNELNNRVIIFGLQESIRHMARSNLWFGDGTSQCVPKIFTQLYTLLYEINDNVLRYLRSIGHSARGIFDQ